MSLIKRIYINFTVVAAAATVVESSSEPTFGQRISIIKSPCRDLIEHSYIFRPAIHQQARGSQESYGGSLHKGTREIGEGEHENVSSRYVCESEVRALMVNLSVDALL